MTDDILIRNATLVDGTGGPRRTADIAIRGERIAAVAPPGRLPDAGARVIDAAGLIVAPGFIDTHTHDDNAVLTGPAMTPKVSQGVTTVIAGNCGISLAPLLTADPPPPHTLLGGAEAWRFDRVADYAQAVDAARPAVNLALLVGHGTLRVGAVADLSRKATPAEIDAMQRRLAEGLDAGAIGFSTGLYYKNSAAADAEEVLALARLLADKGGIYVTHMRNEHDRVLDSLEETFDTAGRAGVPVVISHHKCAGPQNWGRTRQTLPRIEAARRRQRVGLDAYPYVAGSTVLEPEMVDERVRIVVAWSRPHPAMAGRDLAAVAGEWGCSQVEAAVRLAPAGAIYFLMDEEDVRRILAYPPTMIGSDGLPHDVHPHPRLWGTFPRVLGRYCRELGLFTLEEAVHKMTGLSAATFGLADRGVVRPGAFADLVLFDAATIADRATFERPMEPSAGIDRVIVNGAVAWEAGGPTGHRRGRFLKRP